MMNNLFSIFDPSTFIFMNMNWISIFLSMLIIPIQYWFLSSRIKIMFNYVNKIINMEFSTLLNKKYKMTLIFMSMFIFVMLNNLMGMFPYIFTASSHLSFTLSLALPMWLTIIIYAWFMNTIHALAHLVPMGTPVMLMMFMVCIEIISQVIRPITLSVRLAANMIAGHLLMTLLGNQGKNLITIMFPLFIIIQLLLILLESAVAIIQSYVFSILMVLYASEM